MGWWGKAVGGTLGLLVGGPLGAMVGATLGHGVDRGAERFAEQFAEFFEPARAVERARRQETFLATTFCVMGHLAKADGRVSEAEIAFAESVMARMDLNLGLRRAAIASFNQGKARAFDLEATLSAFHRASAGQAHLHRLFLEIQLALAYIDGAPTPAERLVLERCRQGLQVSAAGFRRLEQLLQLQQRIRGGSWHAGGGTGPGAGRKATQTSLAEAYRLLGITPKASDEEVKRAYRKLMSRHHPDKLMSRGVPEEAIKLASQKTHEIRQAYDTITQERGR